LVILAWVGNICRKGSTSSGAKGKIDDKYLTYSW
jgi:hypothetical protein